MMEFFLGFGAVAIVAALVWYARRRAHRREERRARIGEVVAWAPPKREDPHA